MSGIFPILTIVLNFAVVPREYRDLEHSMAFLNKYRPLLASFVLLVIVVLSGFSFPVGFAAQPPQTGTAVSPTAMLIPNTGGNQVVAVSGDNSGLGWIVWVILGIAIIALIAALVSRGSSQNDV